MSETVYTISKSPIALASKPVATPGAEGAVYTVINNSVYQRHCVKVYHPKRKTPQKRKKIEFMVGNKPNGVVSMNHLICWPEELVFDKNGEFVGFIMLLALPGSKSLYQLTKQDTKSLTEHGKFHRGAASGVEKRLKICVNIAIAVHLIHKTGKYTIVDYKPQNILIRDDGTVSIIDVDSFQIAVNGQVLFHADVATPDYMPPESSKVNPRTNFIHTSWDSFSLAVSFYEILFGIHPYAATSTGQYQIVTGIGEKIQNGLFVHGSKKTYLSVIPALHNNFSTLPLPIRQLFIQAFEVGHTNNKARPTPEQWGQVIYRELQNGGIKPHIVTPKPKPPVHIPKPAPVPIPNPTPDPDTFTVMMKVAAVIIGILIFIAMIGGF